MRDIIFIIGEDVPIKRMCKMVGTKDCDGVVIHNASSGDTYRKYKDDKVWYRDSRWGVIYTFKTGDALVTTRLDDIAIIMGYAL